MDRFPKKNLTAKILAVLFAIVLWIYVMNEQNPPIEVAFQVPLEVRNLSGQFTIYDVPDSVRIKVRGPRGVVASLSQQDIKAYVDLKGFTEGVSTAKVYTAIPGSVELVEITPDKVTARLEAVINKQATVEIWTNGNLPSGVAIAGTSSSIPQVQVEGPRTLLDSLYKVVAQVDLNGRNADFTAETPLMAIDREGRVIDGLTIRPGKVNVTVNVSGTSKKTVDIKPVFINELPKNVMVRHITTEPQQVEVYGMPNALAGVDFVYTVPINLAVIDKDVSIETKLQLKDGVSVKNNTVIVHIDVEKK